MGVEHGDGTDTGTKPTASDRPHSVPPDNPGSPGQPSRLESRARAREPQQDNGTQPAEPKDTAAPPGRERDTRPATGQGGSSGTTQELQPEGGRAERTTPAEGGYTVPSDNPGSPGRPSRLESWARAREVQQDTAQDGQTTGERNEESASPRNDSGTGNGEATGGPEIPGRDDGEGETPKGDGTVQDRGPSTGAATGETGRFQDRDAEPFNRPDGAEPTDRPRPERDQPAPEQPAQAPDQPSAGPQEDRPDTAPGTPEPGDRDTQPTQDTGQPPQVPDTTGGDTPSPPENRPDEPGDGPPDGEPTEPQEPRANGEAADSDRDRKAEDDGTEPFPDETSETNPNAPANPILSDVYTDSQGRLRIEPWYGREQTGETSPAETETTDRSGLPAREDLDPAGAGNEAGRGELRDPSDDPADRDLRESDPERPSRGREGLRRFLNTAEDAKESLNKFSEPAEKNLERVEPTGQHSEARPDNDHISAPNHAAKAGDVTIGAVSTAIVLTEIVRHGVSYMRGHLRNRHENNR
ncbi:hypothetical protein ETD83_18780 [Actinomadura soli]|uniref:Uncharacterized protein n=1 Tax=Actinomadura soli TaxID=2508997 RepID=A0A5C4JB65_9ACTN|nr:hypothetical protein [Actinomadura soli]TMQ98964.1 hypothetical protein ETD83_18780 [Actinomadura soli]